MLRALIIGVFAIALVGCASVPKTKNELRSHLIGTEVVAGEYHALAKKWDERAQKLSIDGAPPTLVFDESRRTAEINVQGPLGPYALIELTAVDNARTRMTAYGWDRNVNQTVREWMALIRE